MKTQTAKKGRAVQRRRHAGNAMKPCKIIALDSDADVRASLKEYRPANLACERLEVLLNLKHNDTESDCIGSFELTDHSGHGCERLYSRLGKAAREHVEESKSSQAPSDSETTEQPTIPPDKLVPIAIRFSADGHELTTLTFEGDGGDARHLLKEFESWFDGHITNTMTGRTLDAIEQGDVACDRLFGEAVTA